MKLAEKIISGMCLTYHHGWGLCDEHQKAAIHREMSQLFEHNAKPELEKLITEVERLAKLSDELRQERDECLDLATKMRVERDGYKAEAETLKAAAEGVVSHMDGRQPIRGWLRDNNKSRDALNAMAEAVRPTPESGAPKWVLHLIGPDDVIDQPDELTALREANKLNIGLARRRAADPSDHDPHCWAVVKDASKESV